MDIAIYPRRIALILGVVALYLAGQSLIMEFLTETRLSYEDHRTIMLIMDLFSVNLEESIPTWYATMLLATAAVLTGMIALISARHSRSDVRYWWGLTAVFVYLSMDEGAAIHEIASEVVQADLDLTGYLYFGWQIVAVPVAIVIGLIFLRFVLRLPDHTRNLFILSGIIYLGGAVVVEGISANQWWLDGEQTFRYLAIATVEECMEMIGIVVMIYALLRYMVDHDFAFNIQPAPEMKNLPLRLGRYALPVVLLIGFVNAGLITWGMTQTSADGVIHDVPSYQNIVRQLAADDVAVVDLEGQFSPANMAARDAATELLAQYEDVMIISWAAEDDSIALVSDELPFDREELTRILANEGVGQFVVFDTRAVSAIAGG